MSHSKALRTSKNAVMLLVGTMTRMIASFAFVPYSAAKMELLGFGKLNLTIHLFELFLGLAATAIAILLTRDIARWPRHLNQLLTSAIILSMLTSIAAPLIMIALGLALGYSQDTMQAIKISCIAIFPAAISLLIEAVFVARERAEFVTIGNAMEGILRVILSVIVLELGYGLIELAWVLVFVRTLQLCLYWFCLRQIAAPAWEFSRASTKRFLIRWRVFAAENWMAAIYTNLDVLVLSGIAGEKAVGLYTAAWKFVRLGTVVAKSFTTAVFPVLTRMYVDSKESFHQVMHHTVRAMCVIALPVIIGVSVLNDRIVKLLYKPEFAESGPILQILIWVLLIEFLNPFLSHTLFAQGKQRLSMIVAAISLSVNATAIFFLVNEFGPRGAAIGCILGGSVATVCYLAFTTRLSELPRILSAIARVLVAALGMGAAIYLAKFSSQFSTWPFVIAIAAISYIVLLFVVQAVRSEDIRYFRSTFLRRAAT